MRLDPGPWRLELAAVVRVVHRLRLSSCRSVEAALALEFRLAHRGGVGRGADAVFFAVGKVKVVRLDGLRLASLVDFDPSVRTQ